MIHYGISGTFFSWLDLLIILLATDLLLSVNKVAGILSNYIALLFLNVQLMVMYFSGTFLTLDMLMNVGSVEDLSGNFGVYILFAIPLVLCTFVPAKTVMKDRLKCVQVMMVLMTIEILLYVGVGDWQYSPVMSGVELGQECIIQHQLAIEVGGLEADKSLFYQQEIKDCIAKPIDLPEQPNVIIIFTEGLSQSIIDDGRELMPHVKSFQTESLNFENYYNHTFATYKALSGQLYSGVQRENTETNELISLQDILDKEGYTTEFLNTEPNNEIFSEYLDNMRFDNVLTDRKLANDLADTMSDKVAYELLFDECENQQKQDGPFLIAMYTIGTHMGWNSQDEIYEDGTNAERNKFYNMDYQFGKFLQKFNESTLADNTIIVFIADHATYTDSDFQKAFPDNTRVTGGLDQIPFCIYYKGMEPDTVDVHGKNSFDFAPTILDFLDVSQENYFLGTSLFEQESDNEYEHIFFSTTLTEIYSTDNGVIQQVDSSRAFSFQKNITNYFAVKLRNIETKNLQATISNDNILHIELEGVQLDEGVYFKVWLNQQDMQDCIVIPGVHNDTDNEIWEGDIDLDNYSVMNQCYIEVHDGMRDLISDVSLDIR